MSLRLKRKYPLPLVKNAPEKLPQRTLKKEQRALTVHRTVTTTMILAVLAIATGMVYTWYSGQQRMAQAMQPAPVHTARAEIKPHKVASDAKVGIAQQSFTSQVRPGDNASASIRTNPAADCTISVRYSGTPTTDSGLVTKAADEFGIASWAWTVKPGTPNGAWPVEITCKNKKHSAMLKLDLIVTNKLPVSG